MTRARFALHGGLLALAGLSLPGCLESPFSPVPVTEQSCGAEEGQPCRLGCELPCADSAVDAAAACMLALEGSLDAARTRCTFADGSRVTFAWPLPPAQTDLAARSWDVKIWGPDGKLCLGVRSQPLPWVGGGHESVAEVTTSSGTYRQRLLLAASGDAGPLADAGGDARADSGADSGAALPRAGRLEVRCFSGKHYAASGAELCASCAGGDCRNLPLVEALGLWQPALELRLQSTSGHVTPLFTCR